MNKLQRKRSAEYLENFCKDVRAGKVDWYAITVKYPTYRIAIHTEGAPARPAGI